MQCLDVSAQLGVANRNSYGSCVIIPSKCFQFHCKGFLPFCISAVIALAHLLIAVLYPMQIFHAKQPFSNKAWNTIGQTAFVTELVSHKHLLYLFNIEMARREHFFCLNAKLLLYCSTNFFRIRSCAILLYNLNSCSFWNFTSANALFCGTSEQIRHNTYVISFAYSLIRFSASPRGWIGGQKESAEPLLFFQTGSGKAIGLNKQQPLHHMT